MTRYQLQGQSKEMHGDWSTEYVTQEGDEAATFDTIEEARREMSRLVGIYTDGESVVTDEHFRIIEVESEPVRWCEDHMAHLSEKVPAVDGSDYCAYCEERYAAFIA